MDTSQSQSDLRSKNMVIWCLKPFRPVQVDVFPYRSRYHTRSRSKNQKPKKFFFTFFTSYHFPHCLLQKALQKTSKNRRYDFFQKIKVDIQNGHMTIMYNETLLKSIVKNNFSLWYMVIRGPEHENPEKQAIAMISVYHLPRDKV